MAASGHDDKDKKDEKISAIKTGGFALDEKDAALLSQCLSSKYTILSFSNRYLVVNNSENYSGFIFVIDCESGKVITDQFLKKIKMDSDASLGIVRVSNSLCGLAIGDASSSDSSERLVKKVIVFDPADITNSKRTVSLSPIIGKFIGSDLPIRFQRNFQILSFPHPQAEDIFAINGDHCCWILNAKTNQCTTVVKYGEFNSEYKITGNIAVNAKGQLIVLYFKSVDEFHLHHHLTKETYDVDFLKMTFNCVQKQVEKSSRTIAIVSTNKKFDISLVSDDYFIAGMMGGVLTKTDIVWKGGGRRLKALSHSSVPKVEKGYRGWSFAWLSDGSLWHTVNDQHYQISIEKRNLIPKAIDLPFSKTAATVIDPEGDIFILDRQQNVLRVDRFELPSMVAFRRKIELSEEKNQDTRIAHFSQQKFFNLLVNNFTRLLPKEMLRIVVLYVGAFFSERIIQFQQHTIPLRKGMDLETPNQIRSLLSNFEQEIRNYQQGLTVSSKFFNLNESIVQQKRALEFLIAILQDEKRSWHDCVKDVLLSSQLGNALREVAKCVPAIAREIQEIDAEQKKTATAAMVATTKKPPK